MTETNRKQPIKVKTGKEKRRLCLLITAVLFLVSAGILIRVIVMSNEKEYIPPAFDPLAKVGVPEPDESFIYGGLTTDYGFSLQMASNLYQQQDGSLYVYLTNPKENEVYLMMEVVDYETEETLYRSGVIKPGEYIEKINKAFEFGNELRNSTVKIYAFETENWYSEGTIEIDSDIQPW